MADHIPAAKFAQFDAAMRAADNDDLSDGAWFAVLEETAKHFMRVNRIKGCCNDATHQWLNSLRAKPVRWNDGLCRTTHEARPWRTK